MTVNFICFYNRIHFYVGNIYRLLTAAKYQANIRFNEACSIFGASFGGDGWHHIRKTLQEYDDNPDVDYRDTTMYVFLKYFTPSSICNLIEGDSNKRCELPMFVYPWGTFQKNVTFSNKDPSLSRFCGPSSDAFIKNEFECTIALYKKLKKTGYQPWKYGNTFIGGTFLINEVGERRFIVLQGNHRMSIFAHLGYECIAVREAKEFVDQIRESNKLDWLLVKSERCTQNIAEDVFHMFFKENGNHIDKILQGVHK